MSTDQNGRQIVATLDDLENLAAEIAAGGGGGSGIPQGGPLTADLDADGQKITGLGDPTDPTDAATVAYVLANAGSGVLPDPVNEWEAETVVADQYQIKSGPRVFLALGGGTTGTELPDFDSPLDPLETVSDGDFSWKFIGFIGEVMFSSLAQSVPLMAIPQGGPMTDDLDANGHAFTAFSTLEPDSPPEVPATPDAQDIVDALIALGLVTQAAP